MMLFDPRWVLASKGGIIAGKETDSLCSDNVAGGKGWHGREIKPNEFKREEGHIALRVEGHLALGWSSL
jgi:hypothetical protein